MKLLFTFILVLLLVCSCAFIAVAAGLFVLGLYGVGMTSGHPL